MPEEVLREAADEMLDYKGTGMSVMEMSHRSKAFENIINEAEQDLRDLMQIPDNYKVLFMQGGAHLQFAAIPMNLMKNKVADYIITGQWAKKAFKEAQIYGKANAIASSEDETFSYIPDCSDLPVSPDADYVYICENNTIYGTKFHTLPNTKGKTLVSDISSCFLSEPVDVSKYGLDLRRSTEECGPCGNGHRDHPRGFDYRGCASVHPDLYEIQDPCGCQLSLQYPELLLHLHVRQGLQMAEEAGRSGSDEGQK